MKIECFGPKITSYWEYLKYGFINSERRITLPIFSLLLILGYSFPFLIFISWSDQPYGKQLEGFYWAFKIVNIGFLFGFLFIIIVNVLVYFILKNRSYQFFPDGTIKREIKKLFLIFNKKTEKTLKIQDLTFGTINEEVKTLGFGFKNQIDSLTFVGYDFAEYEKIIKFILKIKPDLPILIGRREIPWSKKDQNKSWRKYEIK